MNFWEGYIGYVYLVIMTITTVGYGDITAKSLVGKSLLMVCSIWGAILLSLIVLVVANMFELKKSQKKAMRDLHASRKAIKSISLAIKYFLQKK